MNDTKAKMSDSDEMRERYEDLKSREMLGNLDDNGRAELDMLRRQFENRDEQM